MKIKKDERVLVAEEFLIFLERCAKLLKAKSKNDKECAMDWAAYIVMAVIMGKMDINVICATITDAGIKKEIIEALLQKEDNMGEALSGVHWVSL